MPRLSKKLKDIWEFFIDPITGKRKYFTRCLGCARKCKQSFRVGSFLPTALSFRGISATTAGLFAALHTIGSLIGCFFVSFCIQKLQSQRIVLIAFATISAVGMSLALLISNIVLMAIIIFATGVFMGGIIPTLLALPVQFAAIGPKYAGTAGGVVGTIQLLGAVVVPNYILTPVARNNFIVLFLLSGICILISGLFAALIKGVK